MTRVPGSTYVLLFTAMMLSVSLACQFDGFIGRIDHDPPGGDPDGGFPGSGGADETSMGDSIGSDPGDGDSGSADAGNADATGGDDVCTSTLTEYGLLCTTCPGAEPQCLVAYGFADGDCLRWRDPLGRSVRDCSNDPYELELSEGMSFDYLHYVAVAGMATPLLSGAYFFYGSEGSCFPTEEEDCLLCQLPAGSSWPVCASDGFAYDFDGNRPPGLPEPGECVTDDDEDGAPRCSTCTREDLSAMTTCRFPPASICNVGGDTPQEECVTCSLLEGGQARRCDGGRP